MLEKLKIYLKAYKELEKIIKNKTNNKTSYDLDEILSNNPLYIKK